MLFSKSRFCASELRYLGQVVIDKVPINQQRLGISCVMAMPHLFANDNNFFKHIALTINLLFCCITLSVLYRSSVLYHNYSPCRKELLSSFLSLSRDVLFATPELYNKKRDSR
jgi:hypothetical protein